MAKAVKHSEMAKEIKKEYLLRHLNEVQKLITDWIPQLKASDPLLPHDGQWGWLSVYRPTYEEHPDSNHMLRQHLRSRSLWRHHTEWERKLDVAWTLLGLVREKAASVYSQLSRNQPTGYMENYVGVALLAAFSSIYTGKPMNIQYKPPDDQNGVACGDYKIDSEATNDEERISIQREHTDYAYTLTEIEEMQNLGTLWREIEGVEKQMQAIASKILKSNDILYPCRFCRHLWK